MNKKLKLLLSILAISSMMGVAAACGGEAKESSSSPTESSTPSTPDESTPDESTPDESTPDESTPDESTPDESTPDESTPDEETKYTVKFVNDDDGVISEEEYEEGATVTAPADPTKEADDGYTYAFAGWDKEVTAVSGDVTYKATYTKTAIEYTIAFTHPRTGMILAAPITYTVENVSEIVFPEVPADLAMEGYTVAWDKTAADITKGDVNVSPVYTAIEYTVAFTHPKTGMPIAAPINYTVENMSEVVFPEVPADFAMEGYTTAWDKTPADLAIGGLNVSVTWTANTYKITYVANGGTLSVETQDVVYGEEYTLATATAPKSYQEFLGWVDGNGNAVTSEVWTIASDVTLTAVYSAGITFSSMTEVPAYMEKADTTESLSIIELDGNKVLEIKGAATGQAPALKVTLDFLKSFFEDENVDYVAFDAKAGTTTINNFRRVTLRANGSFAADCYEHDMTYTHDSDGDGTAETYATTGIRADSWKTFYFSRADYEAWVAQGVTSERLIAAGQFNPGDSIYVDNIRPVTAAERKAGIGSFESGGVRINDAGKTLLFYMLDKGGDWQFNMQVSSGAFTNVGYTNEYATDGIRALQFTKEAGNVAFNFPSAKAFYSELVTATGYYAVDVYVPVGSGARVSTASTGLTNGVLPGASLTEGAWTTIYISNNVTSITIGDDNGGTYYVDNLRSITAAEYQAAQYGFEFGTVGLRTNLLNDETAHSGALYVYNKGFDYSNVKASLSIAEGNVASDANAISNARMATDVVHSGNYSLAFDKGTGYVSLSRHGESEALTAFSGGFTFWIYSTVDIDGVNTSNLYNGVNGKLNGGEGVYIKANTWTQITINAEDIGNGRFLILQGNWSGTIYLDDFQPLN